MISDKFTFKLNDHHKSIGFNNKLYAKLVDDKYIIKRVRWLGDIETSMYSKNEVELLIKNGHWIILK